MAETNNTPLLQALAQYLSKDMYPLHTPGHKQGRYVWPIIKELTKDLLAIDLTELPGLDDLHNPQQAIAASQQQAAVLFGADRTFYLVQGATSGIQAGMLALGSPGKEFVLPRNAHRSAYAGMVMGNFKPRYLSPVMDEEWGFPLGVPTAQYEVLDKPTPVLLLNPSYEGVAPPMEQQVKMLHGKGMSVLVDEAHGSHFIFNGLLPPSAVAMGADIVIHGSHKTLPTMTQTAMAHVKQPIAERLRMFLDILQTTSPSYVLLASLDGVQGYLAKDGCEDWARAVTLAEILRRDISNLKEFQLLEDEYVRNKGMGELDKTRVVFRAGNKIDGFTLARMLREEKLEAEMCGWRHVVLIINPAEDETTIAFISQRLRRVANRIGINSARDASFNVPLIGQTAAFSDWDVVLNPRQAAFASSRMAALKETVGEITAEAVVPYPPGIPLLWPGERITQEVLERIVTLKRLGAHFQGIHDCDLNKIAIISEVKEC